MKTTIKIVGLRAQINEANTTEHPVFGALPTEVANIALDGFEYSVEAEGYEIVEVAEGLTDVFIEGLVRGSHSTLVGSVIQGFERFADAGRREDKKRQAFDQDRRKREQAFLNQSSFDQGSRQTRKERRAARMAPAERS